MSWIPMGSFMKVGDGLVRPEGLVAAADGRLFAADLERGVVQILGDGALEPFIRTGGAANGLAMDVAGRIIVANFGIFIGEDGPLQRVDPENRTVETLVAEIDGNRLRACNYPVVDRSGAIWCTHSTNAATWPEALDGRDDGFLFRIDPDGTARIVADGLRFPNGCAIDASERHIYVCQTSVCDVVRFPILADRSLGPPERHGPVLGTMVRGAQSLAAAHALPPEERVMLGYPDGCNFDAEGNLWVTLPVANRIVAITPSGQLETVAVDPGGDLLSHPTNIGWGGPDCRTLFVASLVSPWLLRAESPVPGAPLVHQA